MVKVVIFDCWDTLFWTNLTPHPFQVFADRLGQSIRDRSYVKSFEKHLMLEQHRDLSLPVGKLLDEWGLSGQRHLIPELVGLLEESTRHQEPFHDTFATLAKLSTPYKLVMLTNSFKQSLDALKLSQRLETYFDLILPSYEIHHIKPAGEFFGEVVRKYDAPASEMIMVGDNLDDDIKPAETMGMSAILIDRRGRYPNYPGRVSTLAEVVRRIGKLERLAA